MRGAVAQDLCRPLCGGLGDWGLFILKSLWWGVGVITEAQTSLCEMLVALCHRRPFRTREGLWLYHGPTSPLNLVARTAWRTRRAAWLVHHDVQRKHLEMRP